MIPTLTLPSEEDASINYVFEEWYGKYEARYVQRSPEYAIVYLSSHTGCDLSCRFCHLTQTGQTGTVQATSREYFAQAYHVMKNIKFTPELKTIHYNFMARGDALDNDEVIINASKLFAQLDMLSQANNVRSKFLISTIIPDIFQESLELIFDDPRSSLYYSLYSLDPTFRKKWLPKAKDPYVALDMLTDLQGAKGTDIVLHWAFIEGANDSEQSVIDICNEVNKRKLDVRFNLVRYNPHSSKCGKESSEETLLKLLNIFNTMLPDQKHKMVQRVGFDVKASCGMFV